MPIDPWGIAGVQEPAGTAAPGDWGIAKVEDPAMGLAPTPVPPGLASEAPPDRTVIGYMGIPSDRKDTLDAGKILSGTVRNVYNFGSATGQMIANNAELGGSPVQMQPDGKLRYTPPPSSEQVQQFSKASQTPLVPISEGAQPGTLLHGLATGVESLTTPQNLAIAGAAWPLGTAARLAQAGWDAAGVKALNLALSLYFTKQMVSGTSDQIGQAYAAYKAGDLDGMTDHLGAGVVQGILAGLGVAHGVSGLTDLGRTKIEMPAPYAAGDRVTLPPLRTDIWSVGPSGGFERPEGTSSTPGAEEAIERKTPSQYQKVGALSDLQAPSPSPLVTNAGSVGATLSAPEPEPETNSSSVEPVSTGTGETPTPQPETPTPIPSEELSPEKPEAEPYAGPDRRSGERATSLTPPEVKPSREDEDAALDRDLKENGVASGADDDVRTAFEEARATAEQASADFARFDRIAKDASQPAKNRAIAEMGAEDAKRTLLKLMQPNGDLYDQGEFGQMVRNRLADQHGLDWLPQIPKLDKNGDPIEEGRPTPAAEAMQPAADETPLPERSTEEHPEPQKPSEQTVTSGAKPQSGAQIEAAAALQKAKGLTPEIEEEALRAWAEGRAYIDGKGNYRVKKDGDSGGPIAPWNKAIKSKYKSVDELHTAAQKYKPQAVAATKAEPETAASEPLSRPYAKLVQDHGRWDEKLRGLLADPKANPQNVETASRMVDKYAVPLRRHLGENYHGALTSEEIRDDFEREDSTEQPSPQGIRFAKDLNRTTTPDPKTGRINKDRTYREADWEVLPARGTSRPIRIRMNRQAMDLVGDAVLGGDVAFGVATLPGEMAVVGRRVRAYVKRLYSKGRIGAAVLIRGIRLADELDRIGGERVVAYISDDSRPRDFRVGTLREELTHWQQSKLGPNQDGIDHVKPAMMMSHGLWPIVQAALLRDGYPDEPHTLVAEAGAKLAAGQTRELGLTKRGAKALLRHYYAQLVAEHGVDVARQVLQFADKITREDLAHARIPSANRKGGGFASGRVSVPPGTRNPGNPRRRSGNETDSGEVRRQAEDNRRTGLGSGTGRGLPVGETVRRVREERSGGDGPEVRRDVSGEGLFSKRKADARTSDEVAPNPERLGDNPANRGERGSIDADLLTLGIPKFLKDDVAPKVKLAGEAVLLAKDDILKVLAPAARGPEAKTASLSVRSNAAQLQRSTDRAEAALHIAGRYFDSQSDADKLAFVNAVEHGDSQSSPDLDRVASVLRTMLDSRREAVRALGKGKLENFIENYFPHIWQQNGKAKDFFANAGKRPLEGAKSFLKKRTIETIADGIEAGLTPVSTNPVELVLLKCREMDKYLTAHHILGDLKENGLLQFKRATADMPDGYARIEDKAATVWGTPSHEGALQIEGEWVAPEPAARILNHYLSPGLREKSALFRGFLGAGNLLNQAQLGWSAFHAAFTTADAMISRFALGLYQTAKGDPLKGLKSIVTTPLAPFTGVYKGHRMLKEWYAPGTQSSLIGELVDAAVQAGGRAKMDSFYQTQIAKKMMQAFRSGNIAGGVLRLPFAVTEMAAHPIMQWLVPRQKLAVFADMAQYEIEKLGTHATDPDIKAALARAWDSVDNRMGQLVYDNLAWHKITKDLAMLSVRSVGWNIGTIREIGGAGIDAAKFAGGKGEFTPRMSYAIALPLLAALAGAIAYYLWHGTAPKHLKDYYAIPDAKGHRWFLPTYMKDLYHYGVEPGRTLKGKIHPLLKLMLEMMTNRDYADKPIMNRHHSLVKQAEEMASHVGKAFEPIALQADQKNRGKSFEERALPFVGVTPAPKALQR